MLIGPCWWVGREGGGGEIILRTRTFQRSQRVVLFYWIFYLLHFCLLLRKPERRCRVRRNIPSKTDPSPRCTFEKTFFCIFYLESIISQGDSFRRSVVKLATSPRQRQWLQFGSELNSGQHLSSCSLPTLGPSWLESSPLFNSFWRDAKWPQKHAHIWL